MASTTSIGAIVRMTARDVPEIKAEIEGLRNENAALMSMLLPYATRYGESLAQANRTTAEAMDKARELFGASDIVLTAVMLAYAEHRTERDPETPIHDELKGYTLFTQYPKLRGWLKTP